MEDICMKRVFGILRLIVVLLCIGMGLHSCSCNDDDHSSTNYGTVSGVLQDAQGNPIAGATIEIYDGATLVATTTTDADGNYSVEVPSGSGYTIQVTADGFETIILDLDDVVEDETLSLDLEMDPAGPSGTIAGVLLDDDGGAPIAGATIEVFDGATSIGITTTDANGEYSIEVPVGEGYRVEVTADGYDSTSNDDVDVTEDTTTTVDFDLVASGDPTGTIQGVVRNADDNSGIEGATIEIYDGADLVATTTTDADGGYSVEVPVGTDYTVRVSSAGFIAADYNAVDVDEDETVILEAILQIADTYVGNGTIEGTITDAINGDGVEAVTITLRAGLNSRDSAPVTTGSTEADGTYSIADVPTGYYTAELTCSGYITAYISVYSLGGQTTGEQNASISPVLAAGETRIVLTWGETPGDLDSHLTVPTTSGPRFHLFYDDDSVSDGTVADLDADDTSSYGPETITISTQIGGTYRYYVNDYDNMGSNPSTALSNSGAQVKVYQQSGLVATFNIPSNQGGTLWAVFTLNGTTITPVNTFSYDNADSDPLP
jgi:5-hydroxyisourate hydrolase-like protein (transthyretin family)